MRAERGFTLMEMLVALIIGAIVVSQLYILTRAIGHDTTKQQMETEAMQRARIGLEMLSADFQRAGMNTSPNPARDPDSMVAKDELSQHAYYRPAVVHLNREDNDATDSVVIVGSFASSNTYQAYVDASGSSAAVSIVQPFETVEDCVTEFNPAYAFLHLFAPNGQTADARIATVACEGRDDIEDEDACGCELTLEDGELFADGPSAFASGQLVHAAANQAALFTVKSVGDHNALVRYFVDFDQITNDGFSDCTASAILGDDPAPPIEASLKIIADYVTDFQVWFRNTYQATGTQWAAPLYYDLSALSAARMLPCDEAELFVSGAAGCLSAETQHLGCMITAETILGAEQVRSAVIRLGVRTEKTDQEVMKVPADQCGTYWSTLKGDANNFALFYNVAAPPLTGDGDCADVGAYKVRTVVTEVAMPNIAARMASFKDIVVNLD
ncbi:MAG: type II secretion system GspH family protein [Proteobacteria bacterium]|nr:type II secretion system GspH family protein [Pseudomonadota bacterium]